jgi:uncharacterized protein HemY
LRDAQDAVLHALLTPEQKLSFAHEFIRRGRTATAMAILELALAAQHSDAMAHFLEMLEYFEAEQARIRVPDRHVQQQRPAFAAERVGLGRGLCRRIFF